MFHGYFCIQAPVSGSIFNPFRYIPGREAARSHSKLILFFKKKIDDAPLTMKIPPDCDFTP